MISLSDTFPETAYISGYRALLESQRDRMPEDYSIDDFKNHLSDKQIINVEKDGESIGFGFIQDKEIHFCIKPKYHGKWLTKNVIRQLKAYDFEYTTVDVEDLIKQRFVMKMGFEPFLEYEGQMIFKLNQFKEV